MQTLKLAVENHQNVAQINASTKNNVISGWLTRIFGCRHKEMSRPFSLYGQAYRTCLDCGARRQFNVRRWEMQGDFYYRLPSTQYLRPVNGLASRELT